MISRFSLAAAAASAALLAATSASAAILFSFTGGAAAPTTNLIYDFNSGTVATYAPGAVNTILHVGAPNDDTGAAPAFGDGSQYLAVLNGGSATLTFAELMNEVSFDWGSRDAENTLTITGTDGVEVVIPAPGSGNQVIPATNGWFRAYTTGDTKITSLTLTSSKNSFEIDNLSGIAVPEPATWAMMIVGFFGLGSAVRSSRRRRVFTAA